MNVEEYGTAMEEAIRVFQLGELVNETIKTREC